MRLSGSALAVLIVVISIVVPVGVSSAAPADETALVELINQSRSEVGLARLVVDPDLTETARDHTAEMIAAGDIFHSSNGELAASVTGWLLLGQNVGLGPKPTVLHQAFMDSESHRANILGDFDLVGIGADRASDGTIFVTVIFMQQDPAVPRPEIVTTDPPPATPPPSFGPPPEPPSRPAAPRQLCGAAGCID